MLLGILSVNKFLKGFAKKNGKKQIKKCLEFKQKKENQEKR